MGTHYIGSHQERMALDAYIKLSRATESVSIKINQHLHSHNLSTSQFGVLEALYHLGQLQVGQLGEKILKSSGNMTLVIDNLERRNLIRRIRRKDDRRCIEIQLTEQGKTLIESILPGHVAGIVDAFGALTEEEQFLLGELCRKLGLANNPANPSNGS